MELYFGVVAEHRTKHAGSPVSFPSWGLPRDAYSEDFNSRLVLTGAADGVRKYMVSVKVLVQGLPPIAYPFRRTLPYPLVYLQGRLVRPEPGK